MSETETAPATEGHAAITDDHVAAHAADGHDGDHAGEALGPVDRRAWAAAIVGGAIAVALLLAMLVAIGDL